MDYIGSDVIYQKLKNVLGSQPMDSTEMFYIVKRLEADVLQNRLADIQNMIIKNTVRQMGVLKCFEFQSENNIPILNTTCNDGHTFVFVSIA